jgi:hypothetical protein
MQAQVCSDTGWVNAGAICQCGCSAGFCLGLCVPGTLQCQGLVVEACDGCQWKVREICPFVCANGSCLSAQCMPGATRCRDAETPEVCDALGRWQPRANCDSGCVDPGVCSNDGGQDAAADATTGG